jgi:hypothetical protein
MTSALDLLGEAMALVDAAERILAEERAQRWCPHTPTERQAAFLDVDVLEALFGGAAGGGKSDALLMTALGPVDVPGYSALILRKTYADLSLPGAIMDRAAEWLRPTAATWNDREKTWRFPSGATLTFGYLETDSDRYRYQGAEFQCVCFDELTQFSEVAYAYLLSRIRRTKGGPLDRVPLRMRGATNPGGVGHAWVAKRWGIQPDGTQDEAQARDAETGELRVFVPSRLDDNPHLDRVEYRRALSRLDATTRAQLERGLWVQDTTGLVLPLTEANFVDAAPAKIRTRLGIDAGSSATTETLSLVVVGWAEHRPHESWIVHAEKHPAMLLSALAERVRWLEERFDIEGIVLDEGALGAQFGRELRQRFGIPVRAAKKNNRLGYSWLMRDAARGASEPLDRTDVPRLYVVRDACEPLVTEAAALLWHEDAKRMVGTCHAYDAALYAWRDVRAHMEEPAPAPKPAVGTPEHAAMLADDLKRRADAARDRKGRPFWQTRR